MLLTATVSRIACTTTETYALIIGFNSFVVDSQTHDSKAVAIKSSGAVTGVADRRYAVHRTDSDGVRKA